MHARWIGIVADTHGLVRPGLVEGLAGCERILHAGDVGCPDVLERLARIAPLVAVRGNNDRGAWARALPEHAVVEVGSALIYVRHALADLDLDPRAAGIHAVVTGHSHAPGFEQRDGVLYLNPGSAGPRRFRLPVAFARLHVRGTYLQPEIVALA